MVCHQSELVAVQLAVGVKFVAVFSCGSLILVFLCCRNLYLSPTSGSMLSAVSSMSSGWWIGSNLRFPRITTTRAELTKSSEVRPPKLTKLQGKEKTDNENHTKELLGSDVGRMDFSLMFIFEPQDCFVGCFSSFLWEKVPRKILQENPWQNPPKSIQQKSPTTFCRGAGPKIGGWCALEVSWVIRDVPN